jgi:acyl carrier protein
MTELMEKDIFKCIEVTLELSSKKIDIDSEMKEIEEWDSLGHLAILVALDKKFNGKVSKIDEMASADTVKKIINLLKLNKLI